MAETIKFLGVGRRTDVDPDEIRRLVADLFPNAEMFDGDDLVAWYARLTDRIALVEAALEVARHRRGLVIAAMHDRLGQSYQAIADASQGGLSAQRASQLAARARAGR